MRGLNSAAALLFLFASLAACADNPEGRFACANASECPSDWVCRVGEASATDLRCYSTTVDASVVGVDVMSIDGAIGDAASDASVSDVGEDGTPEAGTPDAGTPDAGPFDSGTRDANANNPDGCSLGPERRCDVGETLGLRALPLSGPLPTGGVTGMDEVCQQEYGDSFSALVLSDTRYPGTSTGGTPMDWVLEANTCYNFGDGTFAFRTNDDAVTYDVPAAPLVARGAAGLRENFWTGATESWTPSATNCNNWTSDSDEVRGVVGFDIRECEGPAPFIGGHGSGPCSNPRRWGILCVQQRSEI